MPHSKIITLPNGEQVNYIKCALHDKWVCIGDSLSWTTNPDLATPFTLEAAERKCEDLKATGHRNICVINSLPRTEPAEPAAIAHDSASFSLHFASGNGFATAINAMYCMNFRDGHSAMEYINRLHHTSIIGVVTVSAAEPPSQQPQSDCLVRDLA